MDLPVGSASGLPKSWRITSCVTRATWAAPSASSALQVRPRTTLMPSALR